MPPYNQAEQVITLYVDREVKRVHVDPLNGKSWRVDVVFIATRRNQGTGENFKEVVDTFTVASKLGPNQALDLMTTVQAVCNSSYSQGHGDGRRYAGK